MQKSPFISLVIIGVVSLFFAILAKQLGNDAGAQLILQIAVAAFIFYAVVRVIFDFIPQKYLRQEEEKCTKNTQTQLP